MVNSFYNFRVGTKILIGYVIALALMALVIVVAILRINQINETVVELAENLAAEQHLADQVVTSVWATHFYALQYMDQQNPEDLERYRTEYANFDQLLNSSELIILNEDRGQFIDEIESGIQTYGHDFNQVTDLLNTRQKHLLVALDKQGRLAEIKLEQIRANSFFSNDTETSYQAGNAQRALLLMRVAAFQFLESGDAYWIDEFNRWHENFQSSFSKLGDAIQSPIYGTMAQDAQTAVAIYAQNFADIQENYSQQQEIITDQLNVVGPVIRQAGAAISSDVASEFQTAASTTQVQAAQTQWLLLFTMGLAIITALGSGFLISRSITKPLGQVTGIARQVANLDLHQLTTEMGAVGQGDLTRHLTITTRALAIHSEDEIGQVARAFNAIIRQVRIAGSTFSEMAANLRTLTERNALLFEEAQAARQKAEAANQAKSNFLANISHELRTPLNAILGYAQILKRENSLTSSPEEGLTIIEESGRHLLTLINDILDIAKIETGKLWLQPKSVHLPTFLDGVVGIMKIRAKEKGLAFIDERSENLPSGVEVDEKRLRQVLINLLSNAINFTNEGTIKLHTQVIMGQNGASQINNNGHLIKQLRFIISDTGIGIDPKHFATIFQPFEQLKPGSFAVEGSGLGLPISQQLIQAMGSVIEIDSKEGEGSTFWFDLSLPVIEIRRSTHSPTVPEIIGYNGQRKKILLVDDNPQNLALLISFLKPLGFEVHSAQSGADGMEQLAQQVPNLIILDMLMPGLSGREFIRKIRHHPAGKAVIIIGTSASLSQEVLGVNSYDDFLPKPIDFVLLLNLLEAHLGLNWIYEPQLNQLGQSALEDYAKKPLPITPPSKKELHLFYDLAMKGNMPGIYKKALELESQDPGCEGFARKLQNLAKAYDDEQVLAILRPYLENTDSQER